MIVPSPAITAQSQTPQILATATPSQRAIFPGYTGPLAYTGPGTIPSSFPTSELETADSQSAFPQFYPSQISDSNVLQPASSNYYDPSAAQKASPSSADLANGQANAASSLSALVSSLGGASALASGVTGTDPTTGIDSNTTNDPAPSLAPFAPSVAPLSSSSNIIVYLIVGAGLLYYYLRNR